MHPKGTRQLVIFDIASMCVIAYTVVYESQSIPLCPREPRRHLYIWPYLHAYRL